MVLSLKQPNGSSLEITRYLKDILKILPSTKQWQIDSISQILDAHTEETL